jgi:hypothetical protein
MTANLQQQQGLTPPDPAQLHPHWYDRILGGLVAGASGNIQAGSNVTNRRMINAAREYQSKLQPLESQHKQMVEEGPVAESATKVPSQDLKNQLDVAGEGREQISEKERGRHNVAGDGIEQQRANTEEAGQQTTAQHDTATEGLEAQRLKQEGAHNLATEATARGELGLRGKELGLHEKQFEASISTTPDLKALEAEEKLDNQSLDKAEKESADSIKVSHSGMGSLQALTGNTMAKELAENQTKFAAMRAAHAATIQARRQALTNPKGASGAPGGSGNPTPQLTVGQAVTVDGKPMHIKGFHPNGKPIVGN